MVILSIRRHTNTDLQGGGGGGGRRSAAVHIIILYYGICRRVHSYYGYTVAKKKPGEIKNKPGGPYIYILHTGRL